MDASRGPRGWVGTARREASRGRAGLRQLFGEVFGKEVTRRGIMAVCEGLGRWREL